VGARIEAPKVVGTWGHWGVGKILAFGSENGELWCILGRIFTVQLLVDRLIIMPVCVADSHISLPKA